MLESQRNFGIPHLGWREHIFASYGNEQQRLTPSQLFDPSQAAGALETAKRTVENAHIVIHAFSDVRLSKPHAGNKEE